MRTKERGSEVAPAGGSAGDRVLAAWTTLEVLSPQALPEADDLRTSRRKRVLLSDDPEPWNNPVHSRQLKERAVYWFAYLGVIDIGVATRSLLARFPDDNADERLDARGKTTMAVVVLDSQGRPIREKTFLASFAWGYGCVRREALGDLAGFSDVEPRIRSKIEDRLIKTDQDGATRPTTREELLEVTRWLIEELGLPHEEVDTAGVVIRVPTYSHSLEAPEPELLNSFFLDDLAHVRAELSAKNIGRALSHYLMISAVPDRRDVVRESTLLRESLSPDRLPLARWPPPGRHPLVLMQQVAVNHAIHELKDRGLVGVNGPPGTGKTTLLRDIVAHVVLERAMALSKFKNAGDAFERAGTIALGQTTGYLFRLHPSLLGHEIVVASSNNKAVENISGAIPGLGAIADDLDPPLRYFASISDCVAAAQRRDEDIQEGATWGLAAAVLGNAKNKNAFANAFWWDKQRGLGPYLWSLVNGWKVDGTGDQAPPAVLALEDAPISESECQRRWQSACDDFRSRLKAVREIVTQLTRAESALQKHSAAVEQLAQARADSLRLRARLQAAQERVTEANAGMERTREEMVSARTDRDALLALRPGWLARLFATRRYRKWRQDMEATVRDVGAALERASIAAGEHHAAKAAFDAVAIELERTQAREHAAHAKVDALNQVIASARALCGERFPDETFWNRDEETVQKSSPWLGSKLQVARDNLFCAAFRLHRAFVDLNARYLRYNLNVAMALLRGRSFSAEQEPARRSIWATLFLVVPVLSTTFASVARLFGPLGREQIGWLLIDEAGQASPQAAVGAIWRASRVISIGDPLQIEPVVPTPPRLIAAIFKEFAVDAEAWAAPTVSVQALADRMSWLGTLIRRVEGDMWVGAPLRVHRRCENPMFSISNRIAYNGMMVYATASEKSEIGEIIGDSRWLSLDSDAEGKWSEEEGKAALELLATLLEAGVAEPDIFFISPFRMVATRLRDKLVANPRIAKHLQERRWKWASERVGTVHTFQGKEAEAVVLVLGAPNPQSTGARRWAGNPANLLNVAVSRAQRRLYVIGSRKMWRDAGAFGVLNGLIP